MALDISKLLLSQTNASAREVQYYYLSYQLEAVRSGPWKLPLRPQQFSMGLDAGGVKTPGLRLYNLDSDIGEKTAAKNHLKIIKKATLKGHQTKKPL